MQTFHCAFPKKRHFMLTERSQLEKNSYLFWLIFGLVNMFWLILTKSKGIDSINENKSLN